MSDLAKRILGLSSKQIESLVRLQQSGQADIPVSSLVPMQIGNSTKRPLFFVHPAGGGIFCYTDFARHLGPEQSFYGLQARGLDGKQDPYTQVEAMAGHYVELIQTAQPEGPYLLGGWCGGGVIAFEMAHQLEALGQSVALLAMIDSHEPTSNRQIYAEANDPTYLSRFMRVVAFDLGLSLRSSSFQPDHLKQVEPDKQLAHVLNGAKQARILSPSIELTQVRHAFHVFSSNMHALNHYVPRAYSGPVTVFKAQEQADGSKEDLGWSRWATGNLAVQTVPGNHFTMFRKPNIEILAELLKHRLSKAESSTMLDLDM